MMQPKRTKYRKQQKGRMRGTAIKGGKISFGKYGLKAVNSGRLNARQIEAARRAISRCIKRGGKVWIRIFPDVPVTKKPLEVRQGKGKGSVEFWEARVKPGTVMFEMDGVPKELAVEAFKLASAKLSVKTIFAERTVM